jgi:ankyrin repeat protein
MATIGERISDAVRTGNVAAFKVFLKEHPRNIWEDDERPHWSYWLNAAADSGQLLILKALIEAGADINVPASANGSPEGIIGIAAAEGHLDIVQWLLDQGATVNHVVDGKPRCFALTGAAFSGHLEVVRLLVERGAWINCNWANMTPLDHAIMYGQQEVADYLRSVGGKTAKELAEQG